MAWNVLVTIDSKQYALILRHLTMECLRDQIIEESKIDRQGNVSIKITDVDGHAIQTNEQLQKILIFNQVAIFLFIYHLFKKALNIKIGLEQLPKENIVENKNETNKTTLEALDFRKHWSMDWIHSNVEAVKAVEQMIKKDECGLIIGKLWIAYNKKKLIIANEINVDGNVYAINCEIQCKGNIKITTQLFVTDNVIIDSQLSKQCIQPIQWNKKIHHDILVQIQDLQNDANDGLASGSDTAIAYLQQAITICVDNFGPVHSYVANSYNNLGIAYYRLQDDKAIECYEKSLQITLDIFGLNHAWTANLYNNLGLIYSNNDHDRAIECFENALKIRLHIFGDNHPFIEDSYRRLGLICRNCKQYKQSIQWYQKLLEIRKEIYGNTSAFIGDSKIILASVFEEAEEKRICI
ncbi:hypothetical protein RFI_04898 [Reticulomyxa filosa]|uniref:Uncharacterized protein n=1 Tax=Reticulomyxa filosa TaxID=46433 RepID=X6P1W6_RETFI|nr:hypothetical protein RFI_04898 [Reticulomyxa filosa]|eukprot:ETO32221.1 hypothetical protein RFI_04898 [Reticulomyxa filosa]